MLILASRSPQRRGILTAAGVAHRVQVSRHVEREVGEGPAALAASNAAGKAREVATRVGVPPGGAVLGVDTVVALDGRSLGSPIDERAAVAMIEALSGRAHTVISALHLVVPDAEHRAVAETEVRFRVLADHEVRRYAAGGEWSGRAGGYAVQGAGLALVESIHGDVTNVVGLPLPTLFELLDRSGLGALRTGG